MQTEVRTTFPNPQEFFEFAEEFSNRIAERNGIRQLRVLYQEPKTQPGLDSDTPPITMYIGARVGQHVFTTWANQNDTGVAKMVAAKGPGDTTVLFMSTLDDSCWAKAKPYWELLCSEMEKQGWIDGKAKPTDLSPHRKMLIGLFLVLAIAVVLFVPTLLAVLGLLPYLIAQVLWVMALAIGGAAALLSQWNNILTFVERYFGKS